MNIDSTYHKAVDEQMRVPFDWKTNNCGLFVANIYSKITGKDYVSMFKGDYVDEKSAFQYVKDNGGWEKILINAGFTKREDGNIQRGDVIVCENAIGIFDGRFGLFAGGAYRRRNKIEAAYYLQEN